MDCRPIIEKLRKEQDAQMEELRFLLEHLDEESSAYLRAAAAEEAVRHFGRKIYLLSLLRYPQGQSECSALPSDTFTDHGVL